VKPIADAPYLIALALLDDLRRIAEAFWSLELEPRQPLRYMRLH